MNTEDLQGMIIETIESIVDHRMKGGTSPINKIGVVTEEPRGFECYVRIGVDIVECLLPEHLQTWIQNTDIVLVQDLYGDGSRLTVTGKTGSTMTSPSLVFTDEETGKNISGVDGIFDSETGERLDTTGTVST